MAISSETARVSYTGNGATTVYAYTFKVSDQDDLTVIKRLIASPYTETTLTITDDYTVSGVGDSGGGSVTLTTALASTYTLQILLDQPVTQPTSIRNQGAYYPSVHEDALDYLARTDMQQQDQLNRSIRQPESEAPLDMELPCTASRASKYLAFDSDGKPTVTEGTTSDIVVSSFMETVVDDTSASAARTTLDAQRATESLTEDTAPAVGDFLPTYDISASAAKKALLGAIIQGALEARGMYNLGLSNATTTNANDSIKIQGAGATLSATNPLYINLPTVSSPGRVTRFSATADVTINLTGAHWALGTKGDFTDIILRVYAINDAGTLKWGVSNQGGLRSITVAASSATATDINLQSEMLVTSTLTGTSPCREVGWFLGDFDDTGGAAEDLWAVQTGEGEIMVGVPAPVYTDWAAVTLTCGLTGGTNTITAYARQTGSVWEVKASALFNPVFTGGSAIFTLPSGKVMDQSKVAGTFSSNATKLGEAIMVDVGSDNYQGSVFYESTSSVSVRSFVDDTGAGSNYINHSGGPSTTTPFTWVNSDRMELTFSVPILGWSGN